MKEFCHLKYQGTLRTLRIVEEDTREGKRISLLYKHKGILYSLNVVSRWVIPSMNLYKTRRCLSEIRKNGGGNHIKVEFDSSLLKSETLFTLARIFTFFHKQSLFSTETPTRGPSQKISGNHEWFSYLKCWYLWQLKSIGMSFQVKGEVLFRVS